TLFRIYASSSPRRLTNRSPRMMTSSQDVYEVCPRHDTRGVDLISVKQIRRLLFVSITALVLFNPARAWSQETVMATLEGPGEYQLSGDTECGGEATSAIKQGERLYPGGLAYGEGYWEVYLKSGIRGDIPGNRIRVLPGEPLARLNFESCKKEWRKLQSQPVKTTDAVAYSAKKYHRVPNYYKTLVQASEGDATAF